MREIMRKKKHKIKRRLHTKAIANEFSKELSLMEDQLDSFISTMRSRGRLAKPWML